MSIFSRKKERISRKAIEHSSLGTFTQGNKHHPPRLASGGHGQENIRELERRGIEYNINKRFPNGVRAGNIPNHKDRFKRTGNNQTWFPENWTRTTIKKAGEKVINTAATKKPDGITATGIYKKVKVGVKRTYGRPATIFPDYNQTGGKSNGNKK